MEQLKFPTPPLTRLPTSMLSERRKASEKAVYTFDTTISRITNVYLRNKKTNFASGARLMDLSASEDVLMVVVKEVVTVAILRNPNMIMRKLLLPPSKRKWQRR